MRVASALVGASWRLDGCTSDAPITLSVGDVAASVYVASGA